MLDLLNDPDRIVIIDLGVAFDLAGVGNALRIGAALSASSSASCRWRWGSSDW